jgi:dopamine beta-monooxygenase
MIAAYFVLVLLARTCFIGVANATTSAAGSISSRLAGLEMNQAYAKWKATTAAGQGGAIYTHSKLLSKGVGANGSPNGGESPSVGLHWAINGETKKIRVAVAVEATGWVGIGFPEMGGMPGADMLIFEGSLKKLYDAYSVAYERPKVDNQQDWTMLNSVTEEGLLLFEAERDLDTGDNMDRTFADDTSQLTSGTQLIAAWGETEEMHYHGPDDRLQAAVRFFADPTASSDKAFFDSVMEAESEGSVTLHLDDFTVPDRGATRYEWKCVTVADLVKEQGLPGDKPVHMIGYEMDLDPGSLLHHIVLYWDTRENISKCDPWHGPTSMMLVWNRGQSKSALFPKNIGMLLANQSAQAGAGLGIPPKSLRLEYHYENPKKIKGSKDSSGIRLHYSTKLREFTAGTLELADPQVKMVGKPIGDGLRHHTFSCPSSCTKTHLPPQGVTIFYELLHMHQKGQTMEIVHQRDGKDLNTARVEYFDFAFGAHVVQREYKVLPGDSFLARCTYKGDDKLQFGFEARREMCLGTIYYYPASVSAHMSCTVQSDVKECVPDHSAVTLSGYDALNRTFGIEISSVTDEPSILSSPVPNDRSSTGTIKQQSISNVNPAAKAATVVDHPSTRGKSTNATSNEHKEFLLLDKHLLIPGLSFLGLIAIYVSRRRLRNAINYKKVSEDEVGDGATVETCTPEYPWNRGEASATRFRSTARISARNNSTGTV